MWKKIGNHVLRHLASNPLNVIRQAGRQADKNNSCLGDFIVIKYQPYQDCYIIAITCEIMIYLTSIPSAIGLCQAYQITVAHVRTILV